MADRDEPVTLTNCDREPIHLLGAIQPIGFLLAICVVVGVALGILVLGEHLTWNEPVGAAVVLAGILLTQQRVRVFTRRQAQLSAEGAR